MVAERLKQPNRWVWVWFVALMMVSSPVASADEWGQQAHQQLQQWMQSHWAPAVRGCREGCGKLHTGLIRFYQYRGCQPAWVDGHGVLPQGEAILSTLRQAAGHGLDASFYDHPILDALLTGLPGLAGIDGRVRVKHLVKLDMLLTGMILRYAFALGNGRPDFSMREAGAQTEASDQRDLAAELAAVRDAGTLTSFLEQLGPRHLAYRALKKRLQEYRKVKDAGGWPIIPDGATLKFGDRGARVAMLRYLLGLSGDGDFDATVVDDRFDDALAVAVMRFQRRHGLAVDGIVGSGTLTAMNVPVDRRIRQIELNLERWRRMPPELEPYYILVNIPGFELKVVENGRTVETMRAIVGREDRPTPVLSSTMTYLELNPYWQVPSKIAREDLLPKIRKDPQFLVRQNFQVFDSWQDNAAALDPLSIDWATLRENHFPFRLRQAPAPQNALGRVKFIFPNAHSVYIHDTPVKKLFGRSSRSFSSGCVRVEKPLDLAALLLRRQDFGPERLSKVLSSGQRQVVILKAPVPVHLVYLTAWAEENGDLHFRDDIYGLDRQLQAHLNKSAEVVQRCTAGEYTAGSFQAASRGHLSDGI